MVAAVTSGRRLGLLLLTVVGLLLTQAATATAHSEVRARAPEIDQIVGGVVDHVDIAFWTPIERSTILLLDSDGAQVETGVTTRNAAATVSSIEFDPLETPGTYTVVHSEISADGDEQSATYAFTYDPEAGGRVESLIDRDSGPNWVLLGVIAAVALALVVVLIPRRR